MFFVIKLIFSLSAKPVSILHMLHTKIIKCVGVHWLMSILGWYLNLYAVVFKGCEKTIPTDLALTKNVSHARRYHCVIDTSVA